MVQELVPDAAVETLGVPKTVLPTPTPAARLGRLAAALHLAAGSLGAAGLSGALIGLALPPRGVAVLGWFALVPLLYVCRHVRVLPAIGLGAIAGLVGSVVGIGLPRSAAETPLAAVLGIEFALLLGLACGGASLLAGRSPVVWAASVACIGVCLEAFSFAAIPIHLALCFWRWTAVIQIAAITGIWGVSLLVWWTNAAIAASTYRDGRPLIVPLVVLVLSQAVGSRVMLMPGEKRPPIRLAVMQLGEHPTLTRPVLGLEACRRDARLVVLPELSDGVRQARDRKTRGGYLGPIFRTYTVSGFVEHDRGKTYNSAGTFSPRGHVMGAYQKIHLFGSEEQRYSRGRHPEIVKLPFTTLGMPICFDTCFTDVCRVMARMGAGVLASPSNDPPSPNGALNVLHAAFQPFRSIENGVIIARADTRAMSMITDARGQVLGLSRTTGPELMLRKVEITGHRTLYRWWGDWLAQLCVMGALFVVIAEVQRRLAFRRPEL